MSRLVPTVGSRLPSTVLHHSCHQNSLKSARIPSSPSRPGVPPWCAMGRAQTAQPPCAMLCSSVQHVPACALPQITVSENDDYQDPVPGGEKSYKDQYAM